MTKINLIFMKAKGKNYKKKFGEFLREARKESREALKMAQAELAAAINVSSV